MAEALVRYTDSGHVSAETRYLEGMVVTVQEDGWLWGSLELATDAELQALSATIPSAWPRQFFVVKITGVTVQEVIDFLEAELVDDTSQNFHPVYGYPKKLNKRRTQRFVRGNLPGPIRQEISDTGFITLTEAQVRNYMEAV